MQARTFVHELNFTRQDEWESYCKGLITDKPTKPEDIPNNPRVSYKDKGWVNNGDWLGTGRVANKDKIFRSFFKARKFVRDLKLSGRTEWTSYCKGLLPKKPKKPRDVPVSPNRTYKESGWKGWGDWFGTGTKAPKDKVYRSFLKAREFSRELKMSSATEWRKYCKGLLQIKAKLPDDIPANPNSTYKETGWKGWGDWLGTERVAYKDKTYRSFLKAREFVHDLKLPVAGDWRLYVKGEIPNKAQLPADIPKSPDYYYQDKGWKNWPDWLGNENKRNR